MVAIGYYLQLRWPSGIEQRFPNFFVVGAEFQISEYVWGRMKTLK